MFSLLCLVKKSTQEKHLPFFTCMRLISILKPIFKQMKNSASALRLLQYKSTCFSKKHDIFKRAVHPQIKKFSHYPLTPMHSHKQ